MVSRADSRGYQGDEEMTAQRSSTFGAGQSAARFARSCPATAKTLLFRCGAHKPRRVAWRVNEQDVMHMRPQASRHDGHG